MAQEIQRQLEELEVKQKDRSSFNLICYKSEKFCTQYDGISER